MGVVSWGAVLKKVEIPWGGLRGGGRYEGGHRRCRRRLGKRGTVRVGGICDG